MLTYLGILPESSPRKLPESWLLLGWDLKDIQIFLACIATNEHEVSSEIEIFIKIIHMETTRFLSHWWKGRTRLLASEENIPLAWNPVVKAFKPRRLRSYTLLLSLSREHLLQELAIKQLTFIVSLDLGQQILTLKVWMGHKNIFWH